MPGTVSFLLLETAEIQSLRRKLIRWNLQAFRPKDERNISYCLRPLSVSKGSPEPRQLASKEACSTCVNLGVLALRMRLRMTAKKSLGKRPWKGHTKSGIQPSLSALANMAS